jgi:hypothetical protein
MNLSKISSRSQLFAKEDIKHQFLRQSTKIFFFQFICPNLEFIYYLLLSIMKMKSFKEEQNCIVERENALFKSSPVDVYHLPQMNAAMKFDPFKLLKCSVYLAKFQRQKYFAYFLSRSFHHFHQNLLSQVQAYPPKAQSTCPITQK